MKMLQYDLNVSKNDYYFTQENAEAAFFIIICAAD